MTDEKGAKPEATDSITPAATSIGLHDYVIEVAESARASSYFLSYEVQKSGS